MFLTSQVKSYLVTIAESMFLFRIGELSSGSKETLHTKWHLWFSFGYQTHKQPEIMAELTQYLSKTLYTSTHHTLTAAVACMSLPGQSRISGLFLGTISFMHVTVSPSSRPQMARTI